jgi:hypothetical protein
MRVGSRSIGPEQDGQLRGEPLRSLAIRCSACAGLYVFGRGLRMNASKESVRARPNDPAHRLSLKSNRSWRGTPPGRSPGANGRARPGCGADTARGSLYSGLWKTFRGSIWGGAAIQPVLPGRSRPIPIGTDPLGAQPMRDEPNHAAVSVWGPFPNGPRCPPSRGSGERLAGPAATAPSRGRIRVPSADAVRAYFGRLPGDPMSHRQLRPVRRFPSRVPGHRRRRSWSHARSHRALCVCSEASVRRRGACSCTPRSSRRRDHGRCARRAPG